LIDESELNQPSRDLGQGDILRIEDGGGSSDLPELGLIINADCDIAHGKTDGVIAYLPIYSFRSYIERFWAPTYLARERTSALQRARDVCKFDDAGTADLVNWLATSGPAEIASALAAKFTLKPNVAQILTDALARLKLCCDESHKPYDVFAALCRLEKDSAAYARKHINDAKKSMGDGHFFISSIAGLPALGYVVRMRRIYTVDVRHCFRSIAEQRSSTSGNGLSAGRVAHMTSLYQFKIAQLFAHQFSRIGLPDDITALSELAVEDMVLQMTKA